VAGIARDLAAAGVGTLKDLSIAPVPGTFPCPISLKVDGDACPVFSGRLIKGVRNGPSPKWLADRLKAIGLRPINTLVDITNLITYDRARPLHVYDAAKLVGTDDRGAPGPRQGRGPRYRPALARRAPRRAADRPGRQDLRPDARR
jgi:phenylalanyl-tRNA synthetase beta chain